MTAIPEKIVLQSTTKISLNDRFISQDIFKAVCTIWFRVNWLHW